MRGDDANTTVGARDLARRSGEVAVFSVIASLADGFVAVVATRAMGVEERGLYAVVLTVGLIAASAASLGLPTVGRVLLGGKRELSMDQFLGFIPAHSLVGGLCAVGLSQLLVSVVLGIGSVGSSAAVGLAVVGVVSSSFVFDGLHGVGNHRAATSTKAAASILGAMAAIAMAFLGVGSANAYLLLLAGTSGVQTAVGVRLLRPFCSGPIRWNRALHRGLLGRAVTALPYQLTTFATFRLDRYLVGALGGVSAAGIYSAAATLSEVARVVPLAVGQVLLHGRSAQAVLRSTEQQIRRWSIILTSCVLLAIMLVAPRLIVLLFGPEYNDAARVLRLLLVAELLLASWFIDNRLLVGSGRFGAASLTTAVSAFVVLAGDLILVPTFGLDGAAVASMLSYGTAAMLAHRLLRRPEASEV